jgi:hypothetical protein
LPKSPEVRAFEIHLLPLALPQTWRKNEFTQETSDRAIATSALLLSTTPAFAGKHLMAAVQHLHFPSSMHVKQISQKIKATRLTTQASAQALDALTLQMD